MKNRVYPAIFHKEKDGHYTVEFCDIECSTYGNTFEEAVEMAKEALALCLDDNDCPEPSSLDDIVALNGDVVMLVEASSEDDIVHFCNV